MLLLQLQFHMCNVHHQFVRFAEIWLMLLLMLICYKRKTLFVH